MSQFTYDLDNKYIRSLPPERQQKISPLEKYTFRPNGGLFYLRDTEEGVKQCKEPDGQLKISRADTDCATEIFRFELFQEVLAIQGGNRCDCVLYPEVGTKYIVFCELTHSEANYVQPFTSEGGGKYSKAYHQLESSIQWCLDQGISFDAYEYKKAIFGWKERCPQRENKATRSMKGFTHPKGKPNAVHRLCGGFCFKMVRYPDVTYLCHD
nr:hypothetical protein [uncultured Porphyromonas sp.]